METPKLNEQSIDFVRESIKKKNSGIYLASGVDILNSVTDYDHQPYTRWFRGVSYFPRPVIAEREAGWRPIENQCYANKNRPDEPEFGPEIYFESACTTVFPTYSSGENKKLTDINQNCLVQYY